MTNCNEGIMKIVRLTLYGVAPVVASTFVNKHNNNLYFNVQHGIKDTSNQAATASTWKYACELKTADFKPIADTDTCLLAGDTYTFEPVRSNGKPVKDAKGNIIYIIGINNAATDKNDIILFWEIPNKYYRDIQYTYVGECSLVGFGINGKERDGHMYTSPAPVIEILGDVVLTWSAKTDNNTHITQTITYDHKNGTWDVPPPQETSL